MDIQIAVPVLLANIIRYLTQNGAAPVRKAVFEPIKMVFDWLVWRLSLSNGIRISKIHVLLVPFTLILSGALLFYTFGGSKSDVSYEFTPGLVTFEGNSLAQVSNPFVNSYITLGVSSGVSEDRQGFDLVRKMNVVVTAYSSTYWQTDDTPFITASGEWVGDGIIAINSLPFGTKVRIPEVFGSKVFIVKDRLHWRKGGYQVDVWFPTYKEALNFGAKRTYIEILES